MRGNRGTTTNGAEPRVRGRENLPRIGWNQAVPACDAGSNRQGRRPGHGTYSTGYEHAAREFAHQSAFLAALRPVIMARTWLVNPVSETIPTWPSKKNDQRSRDKEVDRARGLLPAQ